MTSKAFLEPSWRFDNQTAAGLLASPFSERLPTSSSAKRGSSGSWPREVSQRHVVVVHKKRHTAAGLHGILTRFPFHTSASTPMGGHLRDRVSPAKVIMKKNKAKGFDGFFCTFAGGPRRTKVTSDAPAYFVLFSLDKRTCSLIKKNHSI